MLWPTPKPANKQTVENIHYIAKSIGTPSNERFDYFSNLHEYKS